MKTLEIKELFDTCLKVEKKLKKAIFFDYIGSIPMCRVRIRKDHKASYDNIMNRTAHNKQEVKQLIKDLNQMECKSE